MDIVIRPETPRDHAAIYDLIQRAFAPMAFASGDEQELINTLRNAGALALSLVATEGERIVGHIALSPVTHDSGAQGWFGLGPISAEPSLQRSGVGAALIAEATAWMKARGARGCILTGDTAYYARHGFQHAPAHTPEGEPAEHFMVLPLAGAIPAGRFAFHPAFYAATP